MKLTINCDKSDLMYMDELAERIGLMLDVSYVEPTDDDTLWRCVKDEKRALINLKSETLTVEGEEPERYFGDDNTYDSLQDYLEAVTLVWGEDDNGKTAIYWEC